MVKVLPKNDTIRKLIKHPVGGPFRAEGAMDWPDDSFTARRVADGDVTLEQQAKTEQPEQAEQAERPHAEKFSKSRPRGSE